MKNRIKEILEERNISQKALASAIGMSEAGLSKAIAGSATESTLAKIADYLSEDVNRLKLDANGAKVKYSGAIDLGGFSIPCYILEDGRRVLSGRGMQSALKMVDEDKETPGQRLMRYLTQKSLTPFIFKDKEPDHFEPLVCFSGGQKINGYEASVLIDLCDGFLEARKHIKLSPRQFIIAEQCEILVRSFAKVGLIALIDEATGYAQAKERAKDELQKFLRAFINEEASKWVKTFPDRFFEDLYRMRGWNWTTSSKRPGVVGKIINDLTYERLGPALKEELERVNPKNENGNRTKRHHQFLTEVGKPRLMERFESLHSLAVIADFRWDRFMLFVDKAYPKKYNIPSLFDDVDFD